MEETARQLTKLGRRELQVLFLFCHGYETESIAAQMSIERKTVVSTMSHVYTKLNLMRFKDTQERADVLRDIYCPFLNRIKIPPAKPQPPEPMPEPITDPEVLAGVDDLIRTLDQYRGLQKADQPSTPQSQTGGQVRRSDSEVIYIPEPPKSEPPPGDGGKPPIYLLPPPRRRVPWWWILIALVVGGVLVYQFFPRKNQFLFHKLNSLPRSSKSTIRQHPRKSLHKSLFLARYLLKPPLSSRPIHSRPVQYPSTRLHQQPLRHQDSHCRLKTPSITA